MDQAQCDRLRDSRILLVGGSGWIGRAVLQVLDGYHCTVLSMDSASALAEIRARSGKVQAFQPTVAIFVAGVTPDRGTELGIEAYSGMLDRVTATLESMIQLPGLSQICYASSGVASPDRESEPSPILQRYRSAKLREEELVQSCSAEQAPLIARVYSLSGPYVRRPENYALFDFIRQSLTGTISVWADSLVYRSYSCVMDLAQALVASVADRRGGTYSTGGRPVELADLAHEVAAALRRPVRIEIPEHRSRRDFYCGSNPQWLRWCAASGIVPQTLGSQIRVSHEWLLHRRPK